MKKTITIIIVLLVVGFGGWYLFSQPTMQQPVSNNNGADTITYYGVGYSIKYPKVFAINDKYVYQELGPGKDITGVKFTIPESMTTGTNLGSDSYVSVEQMPNVQSCTASLFLDNGNSIGQHSVTEGNITYSVGSTVGAAAGNRYEETVYAIPGTNPCIAVRYLVHYGVIENYPNTVHEFEKTALLKQFDDIRKSLSLAK